MFKTWDQLAWWVKLRLGGSKGNNGQPKFFEKYFKTIVVASIVVFAISIMLPHGKSYKYGDLKDKEVYLGEEIIAPFTFAIYKTEEELKRDRQRAEEQVLPVFNRNDTLSNKNQQRLAVFFDSLRAIRQKNINGATVITRVAQLLSHFSISFPDENLVQFLRISSQTKLNEFQEQLLRLARDMYAVGILNVNKEVIKHGEGKISVVTVNEEIVDEYRSFYNFSEIEAVLLEKLRAAFPNDDLRVRIGYQILKPFIRANLIYDEVETHRRIVEARNNVPLAKGTVLEKERIINRNERITKEHLDKLNSLAIELAAREAGVSALLTAVRYFGKLLIIALAVAVFAIFLSFSKNRFLILADLKRVVLIAIIFLLVTFLTYNINRFSLSSYLIPITIGSMLLTIFFDTKVGFAGTAVLSLIIGLMRGGEFNIAAVSLLVGIIGVLSVKRIRDRSWLFHSIVMIVAAYWVSITAVEIIRYSNFKTMATCWMYGALNGFLSPLMVYGLQVLFEYFFDIATDMKLLELLDLNNPLLKKLAMEAPGTYHHSLMVGNLAEVAADAIGANALLARVGAYYHDVGKIEKREYFIENQMRSKNPHEKLSPTMSCLILVNHVKKGLEIAKKYRLPQQIRDFIAEHHGTNIIKYFYQKALERNNGTEIEESTFRYPGPRPRTKETGIVMLADAVEAASRTLKDPSPSRIRTMVSAIVQERFNDSQLDDSPLTLKDLTKIKESFATVLLGTFHARIEYPDQDEKFKPKKQKKVKAPNVEISA
ncbi:MAG: HDIG domain-containing protein [candidate division KSB1 bacterium]|nr:HDIG domain-containing protein [candidate division KSB1 bacterium]MDZ7357711.1 HDIG domain-containing protein [candidate division KSB1 bacterium]